MVEDLSIQGGAKEGGGPSSPTDKVEKARRWHVGGKENQA